MILKKYRVRIWCSQELSGRVLGTHQSLRRTCTLHNVYLHRQRKTGWLQGVPVFSLDLVNTPTSLDGIQVSFTVQNFCSHIPSFFPVVPNTLYANLAFLFFLIPHQPKRLCSWYLHFKMCLSSKVRAWNSSTAI